MGLKSRVISRAIIRMLTITNDNHWKGIAAWRKIFKREWYCLENCEVEPQDLQTNQTNPSRWICACTNFRLSRFLICKYKLSHFEKILDRPKFFNSSIEKKTILDWSVIPLRPGYTAPTTEIFSANQDGQSESRFSRDKDELGNLENDEVKSSCLENSDYGLPRLHPKEIVSTVKVMGNLLG